MSAIELLSSGRTSLGIRGKVRCSSMSSLPNDKSGRASRVPLVGNALIARLLLRAYSVRSSVVRFLQIAGSTTAARSRTANPAQTSNIRFGSSRWSRTAREQFFHRTTTHQYWQRGRIECESALQVGVGSLASTRTQYVNPDKASLSSLGRVSLIRPCLMQVSSHRRGYELGK